MGKNVHNTDIFFKSAYDQFEENPSPVVWEKLSAALDKKDADSNRRKFIRWRKISLLLIVLLAGLILFNTDLLKRGRGHDNTKPHSTGSISSGENNVYKGKNRSGTPAKKEAGITGIAGAGKSEGKKNFFYPGFPGDTPGMQINNFAKNKKVNGGPYTDNRLDFPGYFFNKGSKEASSPVLLIDPVSGNLPGLQLKSLQRIPDFILKNNLSENSNRGDRFNPYWEFTVFGSYDQVGYRLDSDDPVTISNIKHSEIHEPSFSGGVLLARQFTKHWAIQTGLIYSYTAIGISRQKIYAFQDPAGDIAYKYITSSGYAYIKPSFGSPPVFGDSLAVESNHTLQTINVPVSVKYRIGKKKLTVSPAAGIEAGFVTSAKAEVEFTDASNHETAFVNKLAGSKKFYWSAIAGVEAKYNLNKKIAVTIQPAFRYALSPITKNNVVETFPGSFGIRAGLIIKL